MKGGNMNILAAAGHHQKSKVHLRLSKAILGLLFLLLLIHGQVKAQVIGNYDEFVKNSQDDKVKNLLGLFQQTKALARIDGNGGFKDDLPNYVSKVLYVNGNQQGLIQNHALKLSAVALVIVKGARDINQLPSNLFETLPSLNYLVVEFRTGTTPITKEQVQRKFSGEDLEDKIILLKPIDKDK
ncbi:hypothetical protein [Sphingobacterium sp. MYb382]|uniref:hypothetical protein n=1 Tax=Sphingobacterium sp. MYb382 TaxID=2745278 RepID=UPI00309ADCD0